MKDSTAKVLRLLREAGDEGLTTSDFVQAGAGSRFGARIMELRREGHKIETRRVGPSRHRYRLLKLGGVTPAPVGAATGATPDDTAAGRTSLLPASRRMSSLPTRVDRDHPHFSYDRPPSVVGEWQFWTDLIPGVGARSYWLRVDLGAQMDLAA